MVFFIVYKQISRFMTNMNEGLTFSVHKSMLYLPQQIALKDIADGRCRQY